MHIEQFEQSDPKTKKIRLIDNQIIVPKQPQNDRIKFLPKQSNQSNQNNQQMNQFNPVFFIPPQPYQPQMKLATLEFEDFKKTLISNQYQEKKEKIQERSRSPRKDNHRLTQNEIDSYAAKLLNVFQKADERRRQLKFKNS